MLVLTRKPGEKLAIGDGITVTLVELRGGRVRLGIEAPAHVRVLRAELAGGDNAAGIPDSHDSDLPAKPVCWRSLAVANQPAPALRGTARRPRVIRRLRSGKN